MGRMSSKSIPGEGKSGYCCNADFKRALRLESSAVEEEVVLATAPGVTLLLAEGESGFPVVGSGFSRGG